MRPEEPVFRRHQVVSSPRWFASPKWSARQVTRQRAAQSHWGAHSPPRPTGRLKVGACLVPEDAEATEVVDSFYGPIRHDGRFTRAR